MWPYVIVGAGGVGVLSSIHPFVGILSTSALLGLIFLWKYFRVFLLGFLFSLPFMFALSPTAGIDLAVTRVLIPIFFGVWLLRSLLFRKELISGGIVTLLLVLFLGVAAASVPIAIDPMLALKRFAVLASLVPIYFIVLHVFDDVVKIKQALRVLFWSGFAIAAIGLVQFILQFVVGYEVLVKVFEDSVAPVFLGVSTAELVANNPSWLVNLAGVTVLRAFAFFPDPHMFSFYLGLTIPLGLFAIRGRKIVMIIAATVMALALFLSFSRGGYVALIASFAVPLVVFRSHLIRYVFNPLALGSVVLAVVFMFTDNPVSQRLSSSFNIEEGSNSARLATWYEAIDIITDYPLQGVGIGNYAQAIDLGVNQKNAISSHNVYLEFFAEMGIFGILVWTVFLAAGLRAALRINYIHNDPIGIGFAMAIIYYAVHSVFETPQYSPVILPLFIAIVALAVARYKAQSA